MSIIESGRNPLISVITPTLNSARYIEECIASIRLQEYRNIEHIIVDGASTDGTVPIIKKFDGKYNMRWISEPDKSATEAANKGLKQARGDIVSVIPADCFYFPWTGLSVVKGFRDNPKGDVVYGDMAIWNPMSKYGILEFAPTEKRIDETLRFSNIPTQSVFFDRKVMDSLGLFNETLTYVSDWEYIIRAWKSFQFYKVKEVLSGRRIGGHRDWSPYRRQRQGVEARYFPNSNYVRELLFLARNSMHAAEENLVLLANSLSRKGYATRWERLIECDGISRMGIILTVLSTWALYTHNRYSEDLGIGYLSQVPKVCLYFVRNLRPALITSSMSE